MKFGYQLPTLLIGLTTVALVQPPVVIAQSLESITRDITVLIQKTNSERAGHGGIIDYNPETNTYYVLTNEHVVREDTQQYNLTIFSNPDPISVKNILKFPGVDLAILSFTAPSNFQVSIPRLGNSNQISEISSSVYMSVFSEPGSIANPHPLPPEAGKIWRRTLPFNHEGYDSYKLEHNISTREGFSGAFFFNQQAEIIAVHGLTNPPNTFQPQSDIGFAIPINTYKELAAQAYLQHGDSKLQQGDYGTAIASFQQILITRQFQVNSKDKAEAYTGIGYTYFAQKDYKKAIENADEAIAHNRQLAEAYLLKGASHGQKGEHEKAIQALEKSIEINSNLSQVCPFINFSQERLGNLEEVENCDNSQANLSPRMVSYNNALNEGITDISSRIGFSLLQESLPPITLEANEKIEATTISEDGKNLAVGTSRGRIILRNLETNETSPLSGHDVPIKTLAFSKDSTLLASSGRRDKLGKLWNLNTSQLINEFSTGNTTITSIDFNRSGGSLIVTYREGIIEHRLLDGEIYINKEEGYLGTFRSNQRLSSVAINPGDLSTIAVGTEDGNIETWTIRQPELQNTFQGHDNQILSMVYSQDGKTLVSGSWDGRIKIWDLETGESQTRTVERELIWSVAISPDGKKIVSGSTSKVQFWSLDGSSQGTIATHDRPFRGVFFTDNQTVIAVTEDGAIQRFSIE